jgi:hypothetical protein
MRSYIILLIGVLSASLCSAQSINISGRVLDSAGVGIAGAIVKLEKGGQQDTADASGIFRLTDISTIIMRQNEIMQSQKLTAFINGSSICIRAFEKTTIEFSTFDLNGKVLSKVWNALDIGTYSMILPHKGAGVYLYKVNPSVA